MVKRKLIDISDEDVYAELGLTRTRRRVSQEEIENAPAMLETIEPTDRKVHRIIIQPDRPVLVGRSPLCHYIVNSQVVSKEHCKIYAVQHDSYLTVCCKDLSWNGVKLNGLEMQSNSAFLLLHGDSLTLPNDQTFRVSYKVPLPLRPESLRGLLSGGQTGSAAIGNGRYLVNSTELGNGTFGSVHLAVDMIKGRQVACKIIPLKSKDDSSDIERSGKYAAVMREVDILKKLSHPNINEVLDVCETSARTKICVVLGLSTGGDLFSHLVRRTRLNEMEAKYFLLQIFYGIKYLHQKGVAHRDLKPENILLVTPPPFPRLQIADFGLARMFPRDTQAKMNNRSLTVLGTVDYIAPEIAELMQIGQEKLITPTRGDVIAMAGDSWAIGCIAYQMFTGFQPFYPYEYMDSRDHDEDYHEVIPPAQPFDVPPAPETIEDDRMMPLPPLSGAAVKSKDGTRDELVRKAIMECKPDMSHDIWDSVPNARTMIEKLLDKLPQCRWTAKRALECGWMKADRKAMDEMYEKTIDMKD